MGRIRKALSITSAIGTGGCPWHPDQVGVIAARKQARLLKEQNELLATLPGTIKATHLAPPNLSPSLAATVAATVSSGVRPAGTSGRISTSASRIADVNRADTHAVHGIFHRGSMAAVSADSTASFGYPGPSRTLTLTAGIGSGGAG